MQGGDLEAHTRERIIIILEGVLCFVVDEVTYTKFKHRPKVVAYHIQWHDVPLKRMAVNADRYQNMDVQIVTFKSEKLAELAADFLDAAGIPYSSISYQPIERFLSLLKFQQHLRGIYDSDPENLQAYGQLGIGVARGQDW